MAAFISTDLYAHNAPEEELRNRNHHPIVNISINLTGFTSSDKL
jgi:hypothetical protein